MKVLAIRFSGLGDLVMLLPSLRAIKKNDPSCEITLLTDVLNQEFIEIAHPTIDKVLLLDRKLFKKSKLLFLKSLFQLLRVMRKTVYDVVFDFQNFGETATLCLLARAKVKVGMPKRRRYHYGYTKIVASPQGIHRALSFSRLLVDTVKPFVLEYPRIDLNPQAIVFRQSLLHQIPAGSPVIGLHVGSTQVSRRWPPENFVALAHHLRTWFYVFIFVGPLEKALAPFFLGHHVLLNLTVSQLCGALSLCNYFIGNDSGPVHVAAALKVPTLTLFSTGADEQVGVLSDAKMFVKKVPINHISLEEVLAAFRKLQTMRI